jgi:hypothetical protein
VGIRLKINAHHLTVGTLHLRLRPLASKYIP